jgi:hypothetical protein
VYYGVVPVRQVDCLERGLVKFWGLVLLLNNLSAVHRFAYHSGLLALLNVIQLFLNHERGPLRHHFLCLSII